MLEPVGVVAFGEVFAEVGPAALLAGEGTFDEGLGTFFARCLALGMDLRPYADSGQFTIHHIDPAELAPGEFAQMLRTA